MLHFSSFCCILYLTHLEVTILNNKERLEQIKQRKKQRTKKQLLKLAILFAGLVLVIYLVVTGAKSVSRAIKAAIPTPTPTPVAIVTADGIPITVGSEVPLETDFPSYATLPNPVERNNLIEYIEQSSSSKKVCYLTFDDGPNNSITPQVLDILRRYDIKATFFQVGSLIEANPDICRRVYEEGHLIGNHSYSHTYAKLYENNDSFLNEFKTTAELIKNITGEDYFPIVRFPGGSHNIGTYGEAKQEYKKLLAENKFYYCDWNALSGDSEGSYKTVEQLVKRVKSSVNGKNQAVVLMHDAGNKKQTVEALPEILEYLISEGYEFSTLNKPLF